MTWGKTFSTFWPQFLHLKNGHSHISLERLLWGVDDTRQLGDVVGGQQGIGIGYLGSCDTFTNIISLPTTALRVLWGGGEGGSGGFTLLAEVMKLAGDRTWLCIWVKY